MQMVFTILVVTLIPYAAIVAALWLARRAELRRQERHLDQVAVTDAIHQALGAVVAPVVETRPWGPWRVRIPVPADRPRLTCDVVGVAQDAIATMAPRRFEIVLVPREQPAGARR
jgi:hypothetical protein